MGIYRRRRKKTWKLNNFINISSFHNLANKYCLLRFQEFEIVVGFSFVIYLFFVVVRLTPPLSAQHALRRTQQQQQKENCNRFSCKLLSTKRRLQLKKTTTNISFVYLRLNCKKNPQNTSTSINIYLSQCFKSFMVVVF